MLADSGRLAWIWARITLGLVTGLGVVLLTCGARSTPFLVGVLLAVLIEVWAVRALAREWSWLARGSWWWGR